MNFKRVKYKKCPLFEVSLQINFPSILSIDTEEPSNYQEKIRDLFPYYNSSIQGEGQLSLSFKSDDVSPVLNNKSSKKVHHFISLDQRWRISFSKNHFKI